MRSSWARRLLAAALLLGGLRDPRLFVVVAAVLWAVVGAERPLVGPAEAWLPWLGWALLSGLASGQPLASLPVLARWAAALGFASLAAAWSARERESWLKTVFAVAGVLAVAALWTGHARGFRNAMTGLIPPYYNYTAFVVAAASAAAAAWALHPRGPRPGLRAAALTAMAAGVGCLLLARSRGGLLAVAAGALVWAARRWGLKVLAFAAVAAGLAAGAFQAGRLPSAVASAVLKKDRQISEGRPAIWRRAAGIADAAPWLGAGPGSFGAAFRLRPVEVRNARARWSLNTDYAHSEVLQAAGETGWAGLALWLIGFGVALSALLRRADAEPAREAAAVAVGAMAAQLAFDNMLQIPGLAFLFFSALAVADPRPPDGRRWTRGAALAGGLFALAAWLPGAWASGDPARAAIVRPLESEPLEDLAYRAMAAGRLADADALWERAERRAPFDAVYPWRRAQIAAASGRWEAALELSSRAAEDEPGFLNDRVLRAEALVGLGRAAQAREELAAVKASFDARSDPGGMTPYGATVWDFDTAEFARVSALAGRARR